MQGYLFDFFFFFLSLDQGKPTTIMAEIYVESFGNIEEANMVRKLCSLLFFIVCLLLIQIFNRLHRGRYTFSLLALRSWR